MLGSSLPAFALIVKIDFSKEDPASPCCGANCNVIVMVLMALCLNVYKPGCPENQSNCLSVIMKLSLFCGQIDMRGVDITPSNIRQQTKTMT